MEDTLNSKGQVVILGLMLAVAAIVLALALIPAINQATGNARINMNCSLPSSDSPVENISISPYTSATCVSNDFTMPLFFMTCIAVAGIALLGRIIFS